MTVAEIAQEAKSSTDPAQLAAFAQHKSQEVRYFVAGNPHTDDTTIAQLIADRDSVVRLSAAGNLADRPDLQLVVAASEDKWMRAVLAHTFARQDDHSLPRRTQEVLARDGFQETRGRIGETTNYLDLFELLLGDPDARVRGMCGANPRISREQMERLITDRDLVARRRATALGIQFPDSEQMLRLATDRSADVRWTLMLRSDVPREAVEIIAQDTDDMNRRHAEGILSQSAETAKVQAELKAPYALTQRGRLLTTTPFESPPT